MTVRQSLLAILDQGPCYGHQLRAEFERRTGATWPLNVGQIYNTLERLERDGLVTRGRADRAGHVYWEITEAGRAEVSSWLGSPVRRGQVSRDELAIKLAVAATLPGVDVGAVVARQRQEADERLTLLEGSRDAEGEPEGPQDIARALVVESMIFAAAAEVRWLEQVARRLDAMPRRALELELSTERPRRGRPAKADAAFA